MLPPLDGDWTWEAWAAVQVAADFLKTPNSKADIAKMVARGDVAGIRCYEIEAMLQIPARELYPMLKRPFPSDPWREEMEALLDQLRAEIQCAKLIRSHFPRAKANMVERFRGMCRSARNDLEGAMSLSDPEAMADIRRSRDCPLAEMRAVERYFELVKSAGEGAAPFPASGLSDGASPRAIRRKFQDIAGVLVGLGLDSLPGYPPSKGGASVRLVELVISRLSTDPGLAAALEPPPPLLRPSRPAVLVPWEAASPSATTARPRTPQTGSWATPGRSSLSSSSGAGSPPRAVQTWPSALRGPPGTSATAPDTTYLRSVRTARRG